ncbi:hypothetical protein F4604DRAFT_1688813 [Suillus subluteus]|nr:hypothetical protein F4604DRAFT_1688813 [Suillus subluteus]
MDPPSSPSSTITAAPDCCEDARRLAKMIVEAMTCHFALLHYDRASKSMVEWYWPADGEGKMIPPSDLEKGREKYDFRYPCWLCADSGGSEAYVETAVYSWWNEDAKKSHWNEDAKKSHWTARCASDTCGYQVKIDTYFKTMPWVAFQYPRRGPKEKKIASVQFEWTLREQKDLLNRLSLSVNDGITEGEFQEKGCKSDKGDLTLSDVVSTVSFSNCHGVSHLESEMEGLAHVLQIESSWISAPIWLNRIVEWLAHCVSWHELPKTCAEFRILVIQTSWASGATHKLAQELRCGSLMVRSIPNHAVTESIPLVIPE